MMRDAPAADSRWVEGQSPHGTYRLIRGSEATAETALVDRSLPPEEQVRQLQNLEWVPPSVLACVVDRTQQGNGVVPMAAEYRRWLAAPFPKAFLSIYCEGGEPRHPVRDWFWPALSNAGEPELEPGEAIEEMWVPASGALSRHSASGGDEDLNGLGHIESSGEISEERCYLTNRRVIRIARRDPAELGPEDQRVYEVCHLRWPWVFELGTLRLSQFEKKGWLAKPQLVGELEGAYFRAKVAGGDVYELRLPGPEAWTPSAQQIYEHALDLATLDPEREVQRTREDIQELHRGKVVRLATPLAGALPYGLPETL